MESRNNLVHGPGGRLVERGERAPGLPYALVADPDGYVIEISGPGPAAFTPPAAR